MKWFKKKDKWHPIETLPAEKIVMLACDTTDCGWTYDFGWKDDEGKFISSATVLETMLEIHVQPSHWREEPQPPLKS